MYFTESGRPPLPGARTVAGYALKWGIPSIGLDGFDEVFLPGSLTWRDDLSAFVNHRSDQDPIGRLDHGTLRLRPDAVGLWVELDPDYDLVAAVRTGMISAWSISFHASREIWSRTASGRRLRTVSAALLREVSLCDRGAHSTSLGLLSRPDIWADNRRVEP